MTTFDTTADAIRSLCDALIRDDFAYGSDRMEHIIAHAERMEADRDVLERRVERLEAEREVSFLTWFALRNTQGFLIVREGGIFGTTLRTGYVTNCEATWVTRRGRLPSRNRPANGNRHARCPDRGPR